MSDASERLEVWRQAAEGCEGARTGEQGGGDKGTEAPELLMPSLGARGRDWCLSTGVQADSGRAIESREGGAASK